MASLRDRRDRARLVPKVPEPRSPARHLQIHQYDVRPGRRDQIGHLGAVPGTDGITATVRLRDHADPPAVIVLTTYDADDQVLRALRAGAAGFVLKHTPPADIVEAVRRAAAGEPVSSPSVLARLIQQVTTPDDEGRRARELLGTLNERERATPSRAA